MDASAQNLCADLKGRLNPDPFFWFGDNFSVADMFVFADQLDFTGRTSPHGPGLFRVDMVPEPSSILMLGIGFCVPLRRTQAH